MDAPALGSSSKGSRPCRNIALYGFCKFEGKGCEYNHNVSTQMGAYQGLETSTPGYVPPNDNRWTPPSRETYSGELSGGSSTFYPSTNPYASAQTPPFPESFVPSHLQSSTTHSSSSLSHFREPANGAQFQDPSAPFRTQFRDTYRDQYRDPSAQFRDLSLAAAAKRGVRPNRPPPQSRYASYNDAHATSYYDGADLAATYYYQQPEGLNYHLYVAPPPHVANVPQSHQTSHFFFMEDGLRESLQRRNDAMLASLDAQSMEAAGIPAEVHVYHSLFPIDSSMQASERMSKVFRVPTSIYKANNSQDGLVYALRRIEGFRSANQVSAAIIESWKRINHPNIVSLREAFTTKSFGDSSLLFVYDYHPLAETVARRYLNPAAMNATIAENVLWSFLLQLISAVKQIHAAGKACRVLDPSKILVTGRNRLRINCVGIMDVLPLDNAKSIVALQQDDLLSLGQVMASIACGASTSSQNLPKALEFINRHYSSDFKNMCLYLLSKPSSAKSADDVINMVAPRMLAEIDSTRHYNDILESELTKEVENGRLVRLLCKLGFINERPEFDMDPAWSETGDRYLLKLFRDYVFHQVDENGEPVLNLAHVMSCLNKFDASSPEKILLTSRDEQSCLIVSYKDLRVCADNAIADLSRRPRT